MKEREILFTPEERELILNETFISRELHTTFLCPVGHGHRLSVRLSLEEIDSLAGFVAAEAQHMRDGKKQKKLTELCEKLANLEQLWKRSL